MKLVVCIAALAVCANAFVPSPLKKVTRANPRSEMKMAADVPAYAVGDPGITAPIGYFDPLGLAKDEETFKFYRRAEIKHCRTSMLALIGYAVPYYFKFDGWLATDPELKFADIPAGIDALKTITAAGWAQIFFFIAFLDNFAFGKPWTGVGSDQPDVGGDFWYKGPEDPEALKDLAAREINNGRLAMFAIMGLMVQDLVSSAPFPFTTK